MFCGLKLPSASYLLSLHFNGEQYHKVMKPGVLIESSPIPNCDAILRDIALFGIIARLTPGYVLDAERAIFDY